MRPRLSEILRGSVRVEVSGAAPQRLLNAMSEADMPDVYKRQTPSWSRAAATSAA